MRGRPGSARFASSATHSRSASSRLPRCASGYASKNWSKASEGCLSYAAGSSPRPDPCSPSGMESVGIFSTELASRAHACPRAFKHTLVFIFLSSLVLSVRFIVSTALHETGCNASSPLHAVSCVSLALHAVSSAAFCALFRSLQRRTLSVDDVCCGSSCRFSQLLIRPSTMRGRLPVLSAFTIATQAPSGI